MGVGQVITNNGRLIVLNRSFNAVPTYTAPTKFSVGTGTTTPLVGDTVLQTPVDITGGVQTKSIEAAYPIFDTTNMQVNIKCLLDNAEGNTNLLTEFGLINTDGTPLLFSHAVFTGITKTNAIKIAVYEKDKIVV